MHKKLRVVIGSLEIGGAEKHLSFILPKLAQRGWQIKVITLSPYITLADKLRAHNIDVNYPQLFITSKLVPKILRRMFNTANNLLRLICDFIVDRNSITHFFLPESYILGMLAALLAFNPSFKIMSRRSLNNYQEKRPLIKWLERKLHKFNNIVLANSQAIIEQLCSIEQIATKRVRLIYNGIDPNLYVSNFDKKRLRNKLNLTNCPLVLIIVANLIPYKGHRDLLNALSFIKDQLPNKWQLLCVGDDTANIQQELIALTKEQGIYGNVQWLGKTTNVVDLLHAADIGILSSHEEGFSNAILECMVCALPMVVTDVGGNEEAICDQKTGFVVPARTPIQLSQAILKLSKHPQRLQMGNLAREIVTEKFNLTKCIDNYEKVYLER